VPRTRTLKPQFWQDEKLSPLEPIARLVFLGLIGMADDAGRMLDNVKAIDGFIFPETEHSARESLETLIRLSRVFRYTSASGQRLLQIVNWSRHQYIANPNKYTLPGPPDNPPPEPPHETFMRTEENPIAKEEGRRKKEEGEEIPATALVESPQKAWDSTAVEVGQVATLTVRTRRTRVARPLSAVLEHLEGVAQESLGQMGREERRTQLVELVFAYHALKTGQQGVILDDKRESRLRTRLKENSDDVSELLYASDGARKDRHLSGENDRGRKYLGFQTVFRDREQVERLAQLGGYQPGRVHPLAAAKLTDAEASNGRLAD
jgi:hypothetical protein